MAFFKLKWPSQAFRFRIVALFAAFTLTCGLGKAIYSDREVMMKAFGLLSIISFSTSGMLKNYFTEILEEQRSRELAKLAMRALIQGGVLGLWGIGLSGLAWFYYWSGPGSPIFTGVLFATIIFVFAMGCLLLTMTQIASGLYFAAWVVLRENPDWLKTWGIPDF